MLTASIAGSLLVFGFFTLAVFDRAIAPEIESRTKLIGALTRTELQQALVLGIPIDALGGLNEYLEEVLGDFPEVRHVAVLSIRGEQVAEAGRDEPQSLISGTLLGALVGVSASQFEFPILVDTNVVGAIVIEGSPRYIETRLHDVLLDTSVVALAILLIGVELVLAVVAAWLWKPLARVNALLAEQREGTFLHVVRTRGIGGLARIGARLDDHVHDLAARLGTRGARPPTRLRLSDVGDIRLPLFLFALGTEITASFLPVFAAEAERPDWLAAELAAAAPLLAYLAGVAAFSPLAGGLSHQFGARRLFLAAIPPTAIALGVMAASQQVGVIALARGTIAVFYALATVASQEYALRAGGAHRADGVSAAFVATIYGGAFCGSVIGGVIAGRFGYSTAIWVGAAFTAAAAMAAAAAMQGRAGDAVPREGARLGMGRAGAADRLRFGALVAMVAVPMSAATAIVVWYLTPLVLADMGLRPADIARVVMTYYLATILLGPLVAAALQRRGAALGLTVAGALISGLSLVSLGHWSGVWPLAIAVAALGIGHAVIRAPLLALAFRWAGSSGGPINLLRFAERIGAMAALAMVVFWLGESDPWSICLTLGTLVISAAVVFAVLAVSGSRVREDA